MQNQKDQEDSKPQMKKRNISHLMQVGASTNKAKKDAQLTTVELPLLHDVMIICNRFIEVCKDFSGIPLPAEQPLHKFVTSSLIEPTVDAFKQD